MYMYMYVIFDTILETMENFSVYLTIIDLKIGNFFVQTSNLTLEKAN